MYTLADYYIALMLLSMHDKDARQHEGLLDAIIHRADMKEAGIENEHMGGFIADH